MNESSRADLVLAFRAAKKHLSATRKDSATKSEFICWALGNARRAGKITEEQMAAAHRLIQARIGGRTTLSDWLRCLHPELTEAVHQDYVQQSGRQAQITRRAWLNALVEEFSLPAVPDAA